MRLKLAPLHCQAVSPYLTVTTRPGSPSEGPQARCRAILAVSAQDRQLLSALDTNFSAPAFQRCSASRDLQVCMSIVPDPERQGEWSFLTTAAASIMPATNGHEAMYPAHTLAVIGRGFIKIYSLLSAQISTHCVVWVGSLVLSGTHSYPPSIGFESGNVRTLGFNQMIILFSCV